MSKEMNITLAYRSDSAMWIVENLTTIKRTIRALNFINQSFTSKIINKFTQKKFCR